MSVEVQGAKKSAELDVEHLRHVEEIRNFCKHSAEEIAVNHVYSGTLFVLYYLIILLIRAKSDMLIAAAL